MGGIGYFLTGCWVGGTIVLIAMAIVAGGHE